MCLGASCWVFAFGLTIVMDQHQTWNVIADRCDITHATQWFRDVVTVLGFAFARRLSNHIAFKLLEMQGMHWV
jgi:hypothetical protein